MLEELRDNLGLENVGFLHDKGFAVLAPPGNRGVASINHVIRFCRDLRPKKDKQCEKHIVNVSVLLIKMIKCRLNGCFGWN